MKAALGELFAWIRSLNKYFDEQKPWKTITTDPIAAHRTLNTCLFSIANLARLLAPFLPFSSRKPERALHLNGQRWEVVHCPEKLPEPLDPLFKRIGPAQIQVEHERLARQSE